MLCATQILWHSLLLILLLDSTILFSFNMHVRMYRTFMRFVNICPSPNTHLLRSSRDYKFTAISFHPCILLVCFKAKRSRGDGGVSWWRSSVKFWLAYVCHLTNKPQSNKYPFPTSRRDCFGWVGSTWTCTFGNDEVGGLPSVCFVAVAAWAIT